MSKLNGVLGYFNLEDKVLKYKVLKHKKGGNLLKCGYCDKEMAKGFILGDRYSLKWQPEDSKLLGGIWASGDAIELKKNSGLIGRPKTITYLCPDCNKLIIDLETEKK